MITKGELLLSFNKFSHVKKPKKKSYLEASNEIRMENFSLNIGA